MKVLGLAAHRSEEIEAPLEATAADFTMIDVSEKNNVPIKYATLFLSGVRVAASDESPDVIVTKGANIIGLVGILIGVLFRIPVVPRIAGDILQLHRDDCLEDFRSRSLGHLWKSIPRYLLDWPVFWAADGIIVVSEYLERQLRTYRTLAHKDVAVVPVHMKTGVQTNTDSLSVTPDIDSKTAFLTVTNLDFKGKYTGITRLLPAVYEVLADQTEAIFVIAGAGRYLPELEAHIERTAPAAVSGRIHTIGYVDDVHTLYDAADLFLYFSFEDSYPNVIIEALASGLPIIANPDVGIDEQLTHEETGFLIPADNDLALRYLLSDYFNNREKFQVIGETGQETVLERNAANRVGRQMVTALETLLE